MQEKGIGLFLLAENVRGNNYHAGALAGPMSFVS
jgi:hypothetical protein